MDALEHAAVIVLRGFFAEMRQWQTSCIRGYEDYKNNAISWDDFTVRVDCELKRIFDKYCECSKKVWASTFPLIPSFDANNPVLQVTEKGNKVHVVIDRASTTPPAKLRYTLIKTDNAYRVSDQVKIFDDMKNKFMSFDILL